MSEIISIEVRSLGHELINVVHCPAAFWRTGDASLSNPVSDKSNHAMMIGFEPPIDIEPEKRFVWFQFTLREEGEKQHLLPGQFAVSTQKDIRGVLGPRRAVPYGPVLRIGHGWSLNLSRCPKLASNSYQKADRQKLRDIREAAGIDFIERDRGGPGARLRRQTESIPKIQHSPTMSSI